MFKYILNNITFWLLCCWCYYMYCFRPTFALLFLIFPTFVLLFLIFPTFVLLFLYFQSYFCHTLFINVCWKISHVDPIMKCYSVTFYYFTIYMYNGPDVVECVCAHDLEDDWRSGVELRDEKCLLLSLLASLYCMLKEIHIYIYIYIYIFNICMSHQTRAVLYRDTEIVLLLLIWWHVSTLDDMSWNMFSNLN